MERLRGGHPPRFGPMAQESWMTLRAVPVTGQTYIWNRPARQSHDRSQRKDGDSRNPRSNSSGIGPGCTLDTSRCGPLHDPSGTSPDRRAHPRSGGLVASHSSSPNGIFRACRFRGSRHRATTTRLDPPDRQLSAGRPTTLTVRSHRFYGEPA